MSNEEILKSHFLTKANYAGSDHGSWFTVENIESAMEAARKDEAESFAEWIMKNYYETDDDGMWYKWLMRSKLKDKAYTTAELYQIFKTQSNGKEKNS